MSHFRQILNDTLHTEADKRTGRTYSTWMSCIAHWKAYGGDTAVGFRDYLLDKVSPNSALTYWHKFTAAIKAAVDEEKIAWQKIPTIKRTETHREHLSASEVSLLARCTEVSPEIKRMGLFSICTGMRWSDVVALNAENFRQTEKGWLCTYMSKKTGAAITQAMPEDAMTVLGDLPASGPIFPGMKYSRLINEEIERWCQAVGITRKITFHSFRHSYACIMLEKETDIYVLRDLLGHKEVRTTERYARLSNPRKDEAARRMRIF